MPEFGVASSLNMAHLRPWGRSGETTRISQRGTGLNLGDPDEVRCRASKIDVPRERLLAVALRCILWVYAFGACLPTVIALLGWWRTRPLERSTITIPAFKWASLWHRLGKHRCQRNSIGPRRVTDCCRDMLPQPIGVLAIDGRLAGR